MDIKSNAVIKVFCRTRSQLQQYVQEGRVLLTISRKAKECPTGFPFPKILEYSNSSSAQVLATAPQDLVPLPPNMPG